MFNVINRLPPSVAGGMVALDAPAVVQPREPAGDYQAVQTEDQLEALIAALEESGSFSFDTETTGLDPMRVDLVGQSFSVEPGRAWYLPVGH